MPSSFGVLSASELQAANAVATDNIKQYFFILFLGFAERRSIILPAATG
jgi:hypothetical protein